MSDDYDYPAMNEQQNVLLHSWPDDGLESQTIAPDENRFLPAQYGQVTPPPKHWYESKTIWFNAIVIAVGLATSATPALESYMSADMYGVIASFVAFVNAILRLATGQPIKQGGA